MVIRWRSDKIRLVQKVISVVMCSSGASNQMSNCNRNWFMVEWKYHHLAVQLSTTSYSVAMKTMKSLAVKFNAKALKWSAKLTENIINTCMHVP